MITHRSILAVLAAAAMVSVPLVARQSPAPAGQSQSFYDLQTQSLDGKPGNLAQYKGKVSLVVNVASKCGYTPQYEGLEQHRVEHADDLAFDLERMRDGDIAVEQFPDP